MANTKIGRNKRKCESYRLRRGEPAGAGVRGSKHPRNPGSNPQPSVAQQLINRHQPCGKWIGSNIGECQ